MTKLIIMLTMVITGIICQAQVSENREVPFFSQIEVGNGVELIYQQNNDVPSVRVETMSGTELQFIKTESTNGVLKLYSTLQKSSKNLITRIYVNGNSLNSITGKSNARINLRATANVSDMTIKLQNGAYFNGYITSANQIKVIADANTEFNGRIETKNFIGNFKNKSRINLSGIAQNASISARNQSYCNAKNFLVQNTTINLSDAIAIITSKDKLQIDLEENAKLTYFGNPNNLTVQNGTLNKPDRTTTNNQLIANK